MQKPENCEWVIKPCRLQRWIDGLSLVVLLLMVWRLFCPDLEGAFRVFVSGGILFAIYTSIEWPESRITAIGCDETGWWLNRYGQRVRVKWCTGSWRRRDLVVLRWSIWPWHALTLRKGSFSSGNDFRRFRARLYDQF